MILKITPRAKAEARIASLYYESQQPGLGHAFAGQLIAAFDRIERNPHAAQRVGVEARRALMHQFPYCVIYFVERDRIAVVGVLSTWADPQRIDERTSLPSS